MFSRNVPSVRRLILLIIGVNVLWWSSLPLAYALELMDCAFPKKSGLCMAGDVSCVTGAEPGTPRWAAVASEAPAYEAAIKTAGLCMAGDRSCITGAEPGTPPWAAAAGEAPAYEAAIKSAGLCMAGDRSCATGREPGMLRWAAVAGAEPESRTAIPNETLSLYKTASYVTGATLTDQVWYLIIASEAATTGGVFFFVNAATSAMMTYNYECFWNICCRASPGPDGIVPVSATKAAIYRALSVLRVGALALIFGNTIISASVVTLAITMSRTAVYVTNDYVWNRIEVQSDWAEKQMVNSCILDQPSRRILPI